MSKRSDCSQPGPPTSCAPETPYALRTMFHAVLLVMTSVPLGNARTEDGPPSVFGLIDATSNARTEAGFPCADSVRMAMPIDTAASITHIVGYLIPHLVAF